MARTAVVAGTASAVSGRVARHQAEKFADRDAAIIENRAGAQAEGWDNSYPQAAPAPAAAPADDTLDQLAKLGQLHDQGVLTDDEFAAQKAKILGM
jgi:hypothetical protein